MKTQNIFYKHVFVFLLLAVLGFSKSAIADKEELFDKIAAIVDNEIILLSEVKKKALPVLSQAAKTSIDTNGISKSQSNMILSRSLEELIDSALVKNQAREMKITVTVDEVDRAISNMAKENGLDLAEFKQAVQSQGMDFVSYRTMLKSQLLRYKVMNMVVRGRTKISLSDARDYYNDQVRQVRKTGSFEGAHILISVSINAEPKEIAKAKQKAVKIKKQVASGKNFAKLAKELSADIVTAPYGGSLGKRNFGEIPDVLDRIFIDMEPGEIKGPLRTNSGFHVLKLKTREDLGVAPFSEVQNRIFGQLMQEEMTKQEKIWLKELRSKTFINKRML